jgi:hypothetical protein
MGGNKDLPTRSCSGERVFSAEVRGFSSNHVIIIIIRKGENKPTPALLESFSVSNGGDTDR